MKSIELTNENKEVLRYALETVETKTVTTIKDLRVIDKLCQLLEKDSPIIDIEDADFTFLKQRFFQYDKWNPSVRKMILDVAVKLE
jgi:hypothetical protein